MNDTIFALASGGGRSALALVRISGPRSAETIQILSGHVPQPRTASYRVLRDPRSGVILDRSVATYFRAPASFTGEDQLELCLHGGRAVLKGVVEALEDLGLRLAQPGEFTRRAVEAGKLDLTEAEAIADLVDADTLAQRDQALAHLDGALRQQHDLWRSILIEAAALLEAEIDFPDEDLPGGLSLSARRPLEQLRTEFVRAIADHRGDQVRDGFRVALLGAPNAGKSSLLNALVGRDAAIVTEISGTTRDVIEVALEVDGFKVIIADMAGLRTAQDPVEQEGVRRARQWASNAALRLLVVDGSAAGAEWRTSAELMLSGDILVLNKVDLGRERDGEEAMAWSATRGIQSASCQARDGDIGAVREALRATVSNALACDEPVLITRLRHRVVLEETLNHLDRALTSNREAELLAEDVRLAGRSLGRLVGHIGTEDVLDQIFASFCLGK